jgi:serine phosphatase RsbU (regulator of sigma subunit)
VGLEKGAVLLLVSRGVVTCEGHHERSGDEFGLDGVSHLFQGAPPSSAAILCAYILKAVGEFAGESPLCDDQTALALVRTG